MKIGNFYGFQNERPLKLDLEMRWSWIFVEQTKKEDRKNKQHTHTI